MAAAIPMIIGAVAGGVQAKQQQKATEKFNKGAAESNRFADVTGNRTALRKDTSGGVFGGALKGAASFGGMAGGGGGNAGAAQSAGLMAANLNSEGGQRRPQQGGGSTFGGLGGGGRFTA